MHKLICFLLPLSLLAVSCGKSSSNKESSEASLQTISGVSAHKASRSFVSDCLHMEMKKGEKNWTIHKLDLKFNGAETEFHWSYVFYTPNCQTALIEGSFSGTGVFEDNSNKRMLATLTQAKMTSLHYQATASFNKTSACDLNNWATQLPQDIMNSACVKSHRNDFYFDSGDDGLQFFTCDENEILGKGCERITFRTEV